MNIPIKQNFRHCKRPNTITLLLIYALPNTIIVLLSPCAMSIGHYYHVGIQDLYYLSILPLIGFASGPIISPLFSMKYGRKAALIIGSSIAAFSIIGTLFFSYFIASYFMLLVFRFLSVFGASVAVTSVPAMINEYYHEYFARKLMFLISAIFCMWPGIIMGISGFIAEHFGWKSTQIFLLAYTVLMYLRMLHLPETQTESFRNKGFIKPYISHIFDMLQNPKFILFSFTGSILGITMYYFITVTPFIAFHYMKVSSFEYGYLSLIPYLAATAALLLGNLFASKMNFRNTVRVGILVSLPCAVLMLILFSIGYINIFSVFILTAIIIASFCPSFGYSFAKSIANSKEKSVATSLFMFIYMISSSLIPFIAKDFTSILGRDIYPAVLIALSLFLILLYTIYQLKNKNMQTQD